MVSTAAQLLDELMGRHRNILPSENSKDPSYHDPDVCKYYTALFCPHDLFTNTKADLGPCAKVHDDLVKDKFEKEASASTREQFEDEFVRNARHILGEVDKRIQKGKQRLQVQYPDMANTNRAENEDNILRLTDKINQLIEEAEKEGCEGNIEQAQGLLKLCDQLKEERDEVKKQLDGTAFQSYQGIDPFAQEKQMEICTVCGAFLIIGDAQSRLDDHLQGKMHGGYSRLRAAIEEITEKREKERKEKDEQREKERGEWKRKREEVPEEPPARRRPEERERYGGRERSRSRDRGFDRGHSGRYNGGGGYGRGGGGYGGRRGGGDYGRHDRDRGSYRGGSGYERRDNRRRSRSRSRERRRY